MATVSTVRVPSRQRTSVSAVTSVPARSSSTGSSGTSAGDSANDPATDRARAPIAVELGEVARCAGSRRQVVEHPGVRHHGMAVGRRRRRSPRASAAIASPDRSRRRRRVASAIAARSRWKRSAWSGQTHASSQRARIGVGDIDRVAVDPEPCADRRHRGRARGTAPRVVTSSTTVRRAADDARPSRRPRRSACRRSGTRTGRAEG